MHDVAQARQGSRLVPRLSADSALRGFRREVLRY